MKTFRAGLPKFAAVYLTLFILSAGRANAVVAQPEFKIFTRYKIVKQRLDPVYSTEASEANYVTYLYSPLVEFDNDGQLVGGISDRFYWEGSKLIFEIRDTATTTSGTKITAEDVVFSLKRLRILNAVISTFLFDELCPGQSLKRIEDECSGIKSEKGKVVLSFKTKKPIYIDLLTSADFSIVPRSSVDMKTLQIKDFGEGTGPYHLTEINENESFMRLAAVHNHWHYKPIIPQKVLIKSFLDAAGSGVNQKEQSDLFFAGKVDFIPSYSGALYAIGTAQLAKKEHEYNIFESLNISTYIMFFSAKAKKDFTAKERLGIAQIIRNGFYGEAGKYDGKHVVKTDEFFPLTSDASLTRDQVAEYHAILKDTEKQSLNRTPKMHVVKSYMANVIWAIKRTEGKIVYESDDSYRVPPDSDFQRRFDGFFSQVNVSSIDSIASIFLLKDFNWMPYSSEESDKWIQKYLEEVDKSERVKMFRQLHFDILKNGILAPIHSTYYTAISTKNWKLNFSRLFSVSPLWQIEYVP